MGIEARLLLWIHGHASPLLDRLFEFSHELSTMPVIVLLVAGMISLHLARGERRLAWVWLAVGLSTLMFESGLKSLVGRARPELWPHFVVHSSASFPSGHALASATFYPLLAWTLARWRPGAWLLWWSLGLVLPLCIGFGRLYLGLHWPTDVLAGWSVGAVQCAVAVTWMPARLDGDGDGSA